MGNKLKNFFKQRAVAWVVLVLAVAAACFWGFYRKDSFESRKKTELLNVKKNYWVCDDAKILSDDTKTFVMDTDKEWEVTYNSRVAVATLPYLYKWSEEEYAQSLADKWGLTDNDVLLLLVKDGGFHIAAGSEVSRYLSEETSVDIKYAVSKLFNEGDSDGAVKELFAKLKTALTASSMPASDEGSTFDVETWISSMIPYSCEGLTIGKLIFWAVIIFIILSAIKGSGRRGYDSGERPARPAPVPNTGRVTNTRYSSPLRVHTSSGSRPPHGAPAGPRTASSRHTPAGSRYPGSSN
jgi:uncharacterized membrane protein YgcG